jgi:hypothetical protein
MFLVAAGLVIWYVVAPRGQAPWLLLAAVLWAVGGLLIRAL